MNHLTLVLALALFAVASSKSTIRGTTKGNFSEEEGRQRSRKLSEVSLTGDCTKANFSSQVGSDSALAYHLKVPVSDIQQTLDERCRQALVPSIDLSVAVGKGPQFLKNFLDGGTTWNDNFETADGEYSLGADAAIISGVYNTDAQNAVFATPDEGTSATYSESKYFSNFYNGNAECRLGAITCCYTSSRSNGLPTNGHGRTDICAHDMTLSAKSNHIKMNSYTIFDTQSTDDTYCTGFAWEEDTFSDAVKYNTLFHMAIQTNLFTNGFVRNIPGAPMCGCAEQMPIVEKAACTKAIEGYTIDTDTGNIRVHISWDDCGELKNHYSSLPGREQTEKFFIDSLLVGEGNCGKAAEAFMNDRMLIH